MDQVRQTNQGINKQPEYTAAAGTYEQDRGQPQALSTGRGEHLTHVRLFFCEEVL